MNHDDFFALTIDTDQVATDATVVAEIDAHRRGCPECRELEADYHELRRLSRFVPGDVPSPVSAFEDKILEIAEERIEHEKRAAVAERKARKRFLVTACLTTLVFAGVQVGVSQATAARPGPEPLQIAAASPHEKPYWTKAAEPPVNPPVVEPTPVKPEAPVKPEVAPRLPDASKGFTTSHKPTTPPRFALYSGAAGGDEALEVQLEPEVALAVYRAIESNTKLTLEARAEASLGVARCLAALGEHGRAREVAKTIRDTFRGTERQRRLAAVLVEDLDRR